MFCLIGSTSCVKTLNYYVYFVFEITYLCWNKSDGYGPGMKILCLRTGKNGLASQVR